MDKGHIYVEYILTKYIFLINHDIALFEYQKDHLILLDSPKTSH